MGRRLQRITRQTPTQCGLEKWAKVALEVQAAGHTVTTESAIRWSCHRARQWSFQVAICDFLHEATPALGSLETSEPSENLPFLPGIMATYVRLGFMLAHGLDIRSDDDMCVNGEKWQACNLENSGPRVVLTTAYCHHGPLSQATPHTALCCSLPWHQ